MLHGVIVPGTTIGSGGKSPHPPGNSSTTYTHQFDTDTLQFNIVMKFYIIYLMSVPTIPKYISF